MKEVRLQAMAELVDQRCLLRFEWIAGAEAHGHFLVSGIARNLEDHRLHLAILKLQARGSLHGGGNSRALARPDGLVFTGRLSELIGVRLKYDSQCLTLRRAMHGTGGGKQDRKKQLHRDE